MTLRNFALAILALLFTFLPFHAFLITSTNAFFLNPQIAPPFFLAAWKDVLLMLFGLIFLLLLFFKRIPWPKFDVLDTLIILFVLWSFVTFFWASNPEIVRFIWGAKYSLSFLIFFVLLKHFPLSKEEKNMFFLVFFVTAAVVVFFGVLQKFLPNDFLLSFGYSSAVGEFHPGEPIAYCQKISFTQTCRLQSFLSGPNQFAAYLLFFTPLFFFLSFHPFKKQKEMRKNASFRAFGATFFLLALFCLFFAYSRAAWGGVVVGGFLAFVLLFRQQKWFWPVVGTAIGMLCMGIILFFVHVPRPYAQTCMPFSDMEVSQQEMEAGTMIKFFCRVVYRASSSQGHFERSKDGIDHVIHHPWGTGLGDSGPASARFYESGVGFLPESWYLQVGIDSGWIGLILFLFILIVLGKNLLQYPHWLGKALFCGLIGISIMSLKLHAWESASVALTFWGMCGILLAPEQKQLHFWAKLKNFFQNLLAK